MDRYKAIDVDTPFSSAFTRLNWNWAGRIVSFGAVCAMLTTMFSMLCDASRLLMVLGRNGFLPHQLVSASLSVFGVGEICRHRCIEQRKPL